jgi:hypothetical protein
MNTDVTESSTLRVSIYSWKQLQKYYVSDHNQTPKYLYDIKILNFDLKILLQRSNNSHKLTGALELKLSNKSVL